MALKDWKHDKYGDRWNRKFSSGEVAIYSYPHHFEVVARKFKQIGNSSYNETTSEKRKVFYKKSQALKFAKQYMMTH